MKRFPLARLLVAAAVLAFAGCASPPPPDDAEELTVGKVQGEIKVGMDAASVAQILGSPNIVTTDEQRSTAWMKFESLREALDPDDPAKTIEGWPAPHRVIITASKG